MNHRYLHLDLLRTLAVVLMVIYHFAYDLQMYAGWNLGLFEATGWYLLRQSTASLFLLLVGISFAISWNRHRANHAARPFIIRYKKYLLRGLGVIGCGMIVSVGTYVMEPETYVRFGILHMIGASILLLPFFARAKEWNAMIGLGLGFGLGLGLGTMNTSLLIPFGIMPPDFATVDYFPLIPWFGIVLIGYAIGYAIYVRRKPPLFSIFNSLPAEALAKAGQFSILAWPGRHALLIYLVHQPLLLGILAIIRLL